MRIYGYGEDALTLWAVCNRLGAILNSLMDETDPDRCVTFFRPSFGRKGGKASAQFGEFDFILLTDERLLLGESKWDKTLHIPNPDLIELPAEQKLRHQVFKQYVRDWIRGGFSSWEEFSYVDVAKGRGSLKPLAPIESLLSENLVKILTTIQSHFNCLPDIDNMLLFLYDKRLNQILPTRTEAGFKLMTIDYSTATFGNYIQL